MSFSIVTDTSSNLPTPYLEKNAVSVVPFTFMYKGEECSCTNTETFDGVSYYKDIRNGERVTTSQIPPQRYIDYFEPLLKQGQAIVYVGMSSGISGSFHSAEQAADHLREEYPECEIHLIDTLAASWGEGLMVIRAIECREKGMNAAETAQFLMKRRHCVYQAVCLDDLMYLHRGGRLPITTAVFGTVLGIKPLLKGNSHGQFSSCGKVRGKKAGMEALAKKYISLAAHVEDQEIGIVYTDGKEDAQLLAEMIGKARPPKAIHVVCYEPMTGSHVGPGTVALFFEGEEGVREK